MNKVVKIILSIISSLIILVITIPIVIGMLLQIGFIQNFAIDQLSQVLSHQAKTTISIGHVDIDFFNKAILDDVYMADLQGDTLIYAQKLKVGINGINFINGNISLGNVTLKDGKVFLKRDTLGVMNISAVFANFKSDKPKSSDGGNFHMTADELNLVDIHFKMYDRIGYEPKTGVNFKDLDVDNLFFQARKISIYNDDITLRLEHISFREKSGFYLQHLESQSTTVNDHGLRLSNLRLETQNSRLQMDRLYFLYEKWSDYAEFVDKVTLDAKIDKSRLSYKTISYFTQTTSEIPTAIEFEGWVLGPVSNMHGQIRDVHTINTDLNIDFHISGLPDIEQTRFDVKIHNMLTYGYDITTLYREVTGNSLDNISSMLERCGLINFNGGFDGLLKDFTAFGSLTTSQGELSTDMKFMPHNKGQMRLVGTLNTRNFKIGNMLGVDKLGEVTLKAQVDAITTNNGANLTTKSHIEKLVYNKYPFSGIDMNGLFSNKAFSGTITSSDSNLTFKTEGRLNLNGDIPDYEFSMDLQKANLYAIGLNSRDSISLLSARFAAHAKGNTIDNINGHATIDSILYINHIDTVRTGDINIISNNSTGLKSIVVNSDFADIELRGRNSYSDIFRYMAQSIEKYIPSFPEATEVVSAKVETKQKSKKADKPAEQPFEDGYYTLRVNVKQANNVAGIFMPGLTVARGTTLAFFFNPFLDKFNLNINSDYIESPDFLVESLNIDSRNYVDSVSLFASADYLGFGAVEIPNFSLMGGVSNNRISVGARFSNNETGTSAMLNTTTSIYRTEQGLAQIKVQFHPTSFTLEKHPWLISPGSVLIDTTGITIRDVAVEGSGQLLAVDGKISRSQNDTLRVDLSNFDIAPVSVLVKSLGYNIAGRVSGNIRGVTPLTDIQFFAKLDFKDLKLNDYPLGNPSFFSRWDIENKRILMGMRNEQGKLPIMGYYDVAKRRYLANIKFPEFDMVLLEPLLSGILSQTYGQADVDLVLSGSGNKPAIDGKIDVKSYSALVDFTQARYNFAGVVNVKQNRFELPETPLSDGASGSGTIEAWFDSRYFSDLKFGVKARFQNLLCLNTTSKDNSPFYGKAFGSGQFTIEGTERKINMGIIAQTAGNSEFILPLSDVATISEADFITFVDPDKPEPAKETGRRHLKKQAQQKQKDLQNKQSSDMDIKIDLHVLPNTQAQIILDPATGNMLRGRGEGRFNMHINPRENIFTMTGPFEIERGDFHFVQAIIDKWFTIQPGGRLTWLGDPANPDVNINVVYKVKTSLAPLTGATGGQSSVSTVDCGINLSDKLLNPVIRLSVSAPSATIETQNMIRNLLNTEEAVSMQFVALLASGSFLPDMGSAASIGTMSGSLATTTGLEFISNQISNLLSGEKYNLRIGYRPGDNTTKGDEFNFDFGTDIIANKLRVEVGGNYNMGTTQNVNQRTPFSGDAYITWTLNKTGTLKLKGFTRVIDRFDETQGLQESGLGVYFRQDFQSLHDLVERYHQWLENSKKKRTENKQRRSDKKSKPEIKVGPSAK